MNQMTNGLDNQVILFLKNGLSQEESEKFLQTLQSDPELQDRAVFIAQIAKCIRQQQLKDDIRVLDTTWRLEKDKFESLVPTEEYLAEFDQKVLNYIRNRMSYSEVGEFQDLIRSNPYLKDRAAVIAQSVKAAAMSKDASLVKSVASMDKEGFAKEAGISPQALDVKRKPGKGGNTSYWAQLRKSTKRKLGSILFGSKSGSGGSSSQGSKRQKHQRRGAGSKTKSEARKDYLENRKSEPYYNEISESVSYSIKYNSNPIHHANAPEKPAQENPQTKTRSKGKGKKRSWIKRHSAKLMVAATVLILIGLCFKPFINFYADLVCVPEALGQFRPIESSELDANLVGTNNQGAFNNLASLFEEARIEFDFDSEVGTFHSVFDILEALYQEAQDPSNLYHPYQSEIGWNLALLLLKSNDIFNSNNRKQALEILDGIIEENPESQLSQQAAELKEKITIWGM